MHLYFIYKFSTHKVFFFFFQNLSLEFILKIFVKFRKFQPRYLFKIYSYKIKGLVEIFIVYNYVL